MTVSISPTGHLSGIPGWEDAHCELAAGGHSRRAWKVIGAAGKAFLKLDTTPRVVRVTDRCQEAAAQRRAAAAQLAPAVLYADENALLTEYVDGVVWSNADLGDASRLRAIGAQLRLLHDLAPIGRPFAAAAAAEQYLQRLAGSQQAFGAHCLQLIRNCRDVERPALCHNDPVAGNFIAATELQLIDWEYAGDNTPLFDLAVVIEHHELNGRQVEMLLSAYTGDTTTVCRTALRRQRSLYLALWWLWLASRDRGDAIELERLRKRVVTSDS